MFFSIRNIDKLRISVFSFYMLFLPMFIYSQQERGINDTLIQKLTPVGTSDISYTMFKTEAATRFALFKLPESLAEWNEFRPALRQKVVEEAGIVINHDLPFHMVSQHRIFMNEYSIDNVYFQTLPGVYATANLYKPNGKGPFPAVIVMMGHSSKGKLYDNYQAVGHTLALNGYVALCIDPFGAGERGTHQNEFEYHGANLGMSLLNIGESLLGIQVSENIRGIDFLTSLEFVEKGKIGATGASGGGNQTMWLAALDERVKAAVPVVSVGTFESYVMNSNCACELLPNGLTFTEEAGIIGLIAPRALRICSHKKDSNPAFYPDEMMRTYKNARPIFVFQGVPDYLDYQLFDLSHGYHPENRRTMLGWFDLHLKGEGDGSAKAEIAFDLLPADSLMTFRPQEARNEKIVGIANYASNKGRALRQVYLNTKEFDKGVKREKLIEILKVDGFVTTGTTYEVSQSGEWERVVISTPDRKLIHLLMKRPSKKRGEYVVMAATKGIKALSQSLVDFYTKQGKGVVLIDLSGTGQTLSEVDQKKKSPWFFNRSRSEIWLGRTMIGEWVKEFKVVTDFIEKEVGAVNLTIDAEKEAAVAALNYAALYGEANVVLRHCPISYLFDNEGDLNYFSMGIHIPGILKWGDISLIAALSDRSISFIRPVSIGGRPVSEQELKLVATEFDWAKSALNGKSVVQFSN